MSSVQKFPHGAKYDQQLLQGEKVARARYHDDLARLAKILVRKSKRDPKLDLEAMISHEASEMVRDPKAARDILVESDHWQAIDEIVRSGGVIPRKNARTTIMAMAYWACKKDLTGHVEALRGRVSQNTFHVSKSTNPVDISIISALSTAVDRYDAMGLFDEDNVDEEDLSEAQFVESAMDSTDPETIKEALQMALDRYLGMGAFDRDDFLAEEAREIEEALKSME